MNNKKIYYIFFTILISILFGCKNNQDPSFNKFSTKQILEKMKNNSNITNCQDQVNQNCILESSFKKNKISLKFQKSQSLEKVIIKNIEFTDNIENQNFYNKIFSDIDGFNFNKIIDFEKFNNIFLNKLNITYLDNKIEIEFLDPRTVYRTLNTIFQSINSLPNLSQEDKNKLEFDKDKVLKIISENSGYNILKNSLSIIPSNKFELFEKFILDIITKNKKNIILSNN